MKKYFIVVCIVIFLIPGKYLICNKEESPSTLSKLFIPLSYKLDYSHYEKENATKYNLGVGYNFESDGTDPLYFRALNVSPGFYSTNVGNKFFLDFKLFESKVLLTKILYYDENEYLYSKNDGRINSIYTISGIDLIDIINYDFLDREIKWLNVNTGIVLNGSTFQNKLIFNFIIVPYFGLSSIKIGNNYSSNYENSNSNLGLNYDILAKLKIQLIEKINFIIDYQLKNFFNNDGSILRKNIDLEISYSDYFKNKVINKILGNRNNPGIILFLNLGFQELNLKNEHIYDKKISFGFKYFMYSNFFISQHYNKLPTFMF